MKSINRIGMQSVGLPLAADEILEFHAARLLLLLSICGIGGRIDGLTKMAKLDFFSRYPDFFAAARDTIEPGGAEKARQSGVAHAVEAAMVRHHYGPWDKRYYHVLASLEATQLISITKEGKAYRLTLTDTGKEKAKLLAAQKTFVPLVERMREVKKCFGNKSGAFLKDLIYRLFDEEVRQRPMGEVIHS
jgi:hypothetical protein